MRRIQAALPTLGDVAIELHDESDAILSALGGDSELDRLARIGHLGLASHAFTGASHSRLEYLLLQLALIGLTKKIYRDHSALSMAGSVRLPDRKARVSSGEELLKCWAVLSNAGHAKYTYGVERTALLAARAEPTIADWFVAFGHSRRMKRWNRGVIDRYEDWQVHHLLLQARLALLPHQSRAQSLARKALECLVLPTGLFAGLTVDERKKLARLRQLYFRIRLLSMVTLDSYYSHHPVRVQVAGALTGLAGGGDPNGNLERLAESLESVGEWLADELYLHPRAVAIQRSYEVKRLPLLIDRLKKTIAGKSDPKHLIKNTLHEGLGDPAKNHLAHLVRLTFGHLSEPLMGGSNLCATLQHLESKVSSPPVTFASVDRNPFSRTYHLDLLYDRASATPVDIRKLVVRLRDWLIRALNALALRSGRLFLGRLRPKKTAGMAGRLRLGRVHQLSRHQPQLTAILRATIRYLLPADRDFRVEPRMNWADSDPQFLARARWEPGSTSSVGANELEAAIAYNPIGLQPDQLQELKGVAHCFRHSRAPFIVGTFNSVVVTDLYGAPKDEWDGVLLEVWDDRVVLKVIETKHLGSKSSNQTEAMRQLKDTARTLRTKKELRMRRTRIPGLGACLSVTIGDT